jgi:hypothetical protein
MRISLRHLFSVLFSVIALAMPFAAFAQTDLGINTNGVWLSVPYPDLQINQTVRIYAKVQNSSAVDTVAQVEFYIDDALLGSRPVSVIAQESSVAFWDWETGADERQVALSVRIAGQQGGDINANNDEVTLYDLWVNADADGDDIYNQKDNCRTSANTDQADANKNGVGDACEPKPAPAPQPVPSAPVQNPTLKAAPAPVPTVEPEPTPVPAPKPAVPVASQVAIEEPVETPEVVADPTFVTPVEGETTEQAPSSEPEETHSFSSELTVQKEQLNWNTYRFRPSLPIGVSGLEYGWDFGDGQTSADRVAEHTFKKPGNFTVQLTVIDAAGQPLSSTLQVHVGFFNLANWRLWIIIVLLAFIIIVAALLAGMADSVVSDKEHVANIPPLRAPDDQSVETLADEQGGLDALASTGTTAEALPDELALLESIKPNQEPFELKPQMDAQPAVEELQSDAVPLVITPEESLTKAPAKKRTAKKKSAKPAAKRKSSKPKRVS